MMNLRHLAVAVLLMALPVRAAEITVYSPGIVNGPLKQLAAAWSATTGNTVSFAGNNAGRIRTAVTTDVVPADVVVAPVADFADFAPKIEGAVTPLGRIPFAIVVKAGGPKPDISTHAKFVAFVKQAGVLAYANPAVGSLTGAMVEGMLKRPEFAGVELRPIKGMIGDAIVRGDAPYGGGALTEEIMAKGAEIVGPFPDDLGLKLDVSGAVLKVSAHPAEANDFLRYVTRPEAAATWKAGGVVKP
jgi:ABC-type molybdate transport system substrate-binding protein